MPKLILYSRELKKNTYTQYYDLVIESSARSDSDSDSDSDEDVKRPPKKLDDKSGSKSKLLKNHL